MCTQINGIRAAVGQKQTSDEIKMENGIFYVVKGLEFASDSQKNSRTVFRQLDFRKKK